MSKLPIFWYRTTQRQYLWRFKVNEDKKKPDFNIEIKNNLYIKPLYVRRES